MVYIEPYGQLVKLEKMWKEIYEINEKLGQFQA